MNFVFEPNFPQENSYEFLNQKTEQNVLPLCLMGEPLYLWSSKKESKIFKEYFVLYNVHIFHLYTIRHGLGVRIAGSHPAGPGSIPGVGTRFF